MKMPIRTFARVCLLVAGIAALVLGHGFILYYATAHAALSTAVASGVVVLLVAKHLRMLNLLGRRTRTGKEE
jgi:hypothetical protein